MNFGLSEDQLLFKRSLGRFLAERCPTTRVRAIMESRSGYDPSLWGDLVGLGVPGLVIPSALGGSGLELLDLALAAEELGYAATPGPFLGNAMATVALLESTDDALRAHWLPQVAAGEALLTVAIGEEGAQWDPERVEARVVGGKLKGTKPFVPGATESDAILVAAAGEDGPALWIVEKDGVGVEIRELRVLDQTRRLQHVTFRGAPATRVVGGRVAMRRALDAGAVLIAAEAYGGSRRCLDMTLSYVMQREQFGQLVGAFQAIKHQLANLACDLEPALSLWWYAAHAFDRIRDEAGRQAAMAKALLCDLFDRVTRECTELHGGIGFTWEYDLHLWVRRAIFDRGFLGESAFHRERAALLARW